MSHSTYSNVNFCDICNLSMKDFLKHTLSRSHQKRTRDYGSWWIMDLGLWIMDHGLWIMDLDYGSWLWILDGSWLWILIMDLDYGSWLWILDYGLWILMKLRRLHLHNHNSSLKVPHHQLVKQSLPFTNLQGFRPWFPNLNPYLKTWREYMTLKKTTAFSFLKSFFTRT